MAVSVNRPVNLSVGPATRITGLNSAKYAASELPTAFTGFGRAGNIVWTLPKILIYIKSRRAQ
jgi:hypothetical protein